MANFACAAARMNCSSRYAGLIGAGEEARVPVEEFNRFGVDTRLVRTENNIQMLQCIILVDDRGDKLLVTVMPSEDRLGTYAPYVQEELFSDIFLLHTNLSDYPASLAALRMAGKHRIRTSLDLELWAIEQLSEQELRRVMGLCDFIFCNIATIIAGEARGSFFGLDFLNDNPRALIIITLGNQGSALVDGEDVILFPAYPVLAVDTTGAGDCFAAAFAVAICHDWLPVQACEFANAAAALSVTAPGAREALPTFRQVLAFMERHKNPGGKRMAWSEFCAALRKS